MDDISPLLLILFVGAFVIFGIVLLLSGSNARKRWAADKDRRKQEAHSRGDLNAADAISRETMPDPRKYWRDKIEGG